MCKRRRQIENPKNPKASHKPRNSILPGTRHFIPAALLRPAERFPCIDRCHTTHVASDNNNQGLGLLGSPQQSQSQLQALGTWKFFTRCILNRGQVLASDFENKNKCDNVLFPLASHGVFLCAYCWFASNKCSPFRTNGRLKAVITLYSLPHRHLNAAT